MKSYVNKKAGLKLNDNKGITHKMGQYSMEKQNKIYIYIYMNKFPTHEIIYHIKI
jgi:hypothetical protein